MFNTYKMFVCDEYEAAAFISRGKCNRHEYQYSMSVASIIIILHKNTRVPIKDDVMRDFSTRATQKVNF